MTCRFLRILLLMFVLIPGEKSLMAQERNRSNQKLCKAVYEEDWTKVHKLVRKQIKQWSYLDTSLGYPSYSMAIDSLVAIFLQSPCVEEAFADKCAIKISIWPGTSVVGIKFSGHDGTSEFCYTIQEGQMRAIRINGILHIPLKGREKLVYQGSGRCKGFIEEQRRLCREQEESH